MEKLNLAITVRKRHDDFADNIMKNHQMVVPNHYHVPLTYLQKKKSHDITVIHKNLEKMMERTFHTRILQYEKQYYEKVNTLDRTKMLQTLEHIHSQPSEKSQLIHIFKKMGVITQNQKVWQETNNTMRIYEEEMQILKRKLQLQEENLTKVKGREQLEIPIQKISKEIIEKIKQEMRMERLRQGLD